MQHRIPLISIKKRVNILHFFHKFFNMASNKLFSQFPKEYTVMEKVRYTVNRHVNNYYIDWTTEEIGGLTDFLRPNITPVTEKLVKEYISRDEKAKNERLAFAFKGNGPVQIAFREKLRDGTIKSLTGAKDEAATLWRQHSDNYSSEKAVVSQHPDGRGRLIAKKRTHEESQHEYRLRKQEVREGELTEYAVRNYKMRLIENVLAARPRMYNILKAETSHEQARTVGQYLSEKIPHYTAPKTKDAIRADVMCHTLVKIVSDTE